LQIILVTVAILAVARLIAPLIIGLLDRVFHADLDLTRRFPGAGSDRKLLLSGAAAHPIGAARGTMVIAVLEARGLWSLFMA
jgi:hypothetical protein